MSDPERFLSPGSDSTQLERELLGSVRDVGPQGDAKQRAWSGIAAGLGAATVIGAGTATGVASAGKTLTTSGIFAKVALAAAVTGAAVVGGYWVLRAPQTDSASRSAPSVAPLPVPAPAVTVAEPAESITPPEAPPTAVTPPRASAKRAAGTSAEMLAAESALLTQARAQLRGGDAKAAQATLERLRAEFPGGVLQQEREVLAIEVLAQRGDAAAARQRAQRFIKAHPKSPHNEALHRFLQEP